MRPDTVIESLTVSAIEAHYHGDEFTLRAILKELSTDDCEDVFGSISFLAGIVLSQVTTGGRGTHAFDVGLTDGSQTEVTSLIAAIFAGIQNRDSDGLFAVYRGATAEELAEAQLLLLGLINDMRNAANEEPE